MAFTQKMMEDQQLQLDELTEELSRLSSEFDLAMQEGNFSPDDLHDADAQDHSPELQAMMEEAEELARRQGAARAAQTSTQKTYDSPRAGRGRQGIVRL